MYASISTIGNIQLKNPHPDHLPLLFRRGALIPSFIKDMQSWYESKRVGKREYPVWSYDNYVDHKAKGWIEKVNFN